MKNSTETTTATKECNYCSRQSKTDPCEFCGNGINCRRCNCTMNEKNEGYIKPELCRDCESDLLDLIEDFVHAGYSALEELDQWKEVMGDSEDHRTQDAIDELEDIIARAHRIAA